MLCSLFKRQTERETCTCDNDQGRVLVICIECVTYPCKNMYVPHTQNTSSKESPSAPSNRQTASALCARSPKSASHKSWGAYCTEATATATATGRRVRTVVCAFANSHSAGTRPELFRLNRARVLAAFRRVCACVVCATATQTR